MPNNPNSRAVVYMPTLKNPIAIPANPPTKRLTINTKMANTKLLEIRLPWLNFIGIKYVIASITSPSSKPAKYI